jgi:hypothetical protein
MTPDEAREFFRMGDMKETARSRLASKVLKDEFAHREGVKESRATGDGVAWLLGQPRPRGVSQRPRWFDHGTRWTKDGQPYCLVGQPYGLLPDAIRELAALGEHGIDVMIDVAPAWHYPGQVLSVRVFAPGAWPPRSR